MEQVTEPTAGGAVPAMAAVLQAGLCGVVDAVSEGHPDLSQATVGAALAMTVISEQIQRMN